MAKEILPVTKPRPVAIRKMRVGDHRSILRVWRKSEGMCLGVDDEAAGFALYLRRNPGLCFVALAGKEIIGTVLCGHDGRRAILGHLAVVPTRRGTGLGRALVERCLASLAAQGVRKCNVFVMKGNPAGLRFWEHLGYGKLDDDYWTLQAPVRRIRPGSLRR